MRNSILKSMRGILLKNAVFFFFATTMLAGYHYILAAYGDIDDYYTLASTDGPFSVSPAPGGGYLRGPDTASFSAGQVIGWSSNFCAVHGMDFSGSTTMVRLPQDGLKELQVSRRTTRFPGDQVRCGPKVYGLRIPDDAVPGLYELRREVAFREGTLWPLRAHFPVLAFRVVGAPAVDRDAVGQ